MRILTLLVLFSLFALSAMASPFDEANQLYDQGKFQDAKQRYEQLLAGGTCTANVYYNLGNAEYRLGQPGRAILGYERALALQPAHPEAAANLKLAREQSGARLLDATWLDHVVLPWRATIYTMIAAAAAWLIVGSIAAMTAWRLSDHVGVWTVLILSLIAAGYSTLGILQAKQEQALAIVTTKEAPARLSPADSAATAELLPAGSRVSILSEHGAWIYCELPGNTRGWLSAKALERVRSENS